MPFIEHWNLQRNDESGQNDWQVAREHYARDVALFLIFDPRRGFLFERRRGRNDSLDGKLVIPGGKIEDLGEAASPLWAATRECWEEMRVVGLDVILLPDLLDRRQPGGVRLYPFLMTRLWGQVEDWYPSTRELVWMSPGEVFCGDGVSSEFELATTRQILLNAREAMRKEGWLN